MVLATVGSAVASDLGLAPAAAAAEAPESLRFGSLEPLVGLMQDTPIERLMPVLVDRIRSGTELKQLVAAATLANARTFGGEDYIGFHTMMALSPAFHMAQEMPKGREALPILKVLYRNTNRIHATGGRSAEVLHPVSPTAEDKPTPETIREAVRRKDMARAEALFAKSAMGKASDAFNDLLLTVQDQPEVHRVVLPYRAYDLLDVIGAEHAHTMLRQSIHYCVKAESGRTAANSVYFDEPERILPAVLEEYKLLGREPGTKTADDAWVDALSQTLFKVSAADAARAVGSALAEGYAPDVIGEAISLTANQLVLRDLGRRPQEEDTGKPPGSVHGDSIGVHASDSANAWRHMARVTNARNTFSCLILGGYQVARDRLVRGDAFQTWAALPVQWHLAQIKSKDPEGLLKEAEAAIQANMQGHAAAIIHRYGELGFPARPVFDLMLRYATSEDGALHAEKYYRTVSMEFANTRPAFRWRQLVALARVTASEYGRPAPGYAEACRLLNI
jgi:hypothetical protein